MFYSPKNNAFYPSELKEDYVSARSWPDDGIAVDASVFIEFSSPPPAGKVRVAGDDNLPSWGDIPPLTQEELIYQAETKKAGLISSAKQTISLWQSELLLGNISDDDKASLTAWIAYIKAVQVVDTSKAPDINWPVAQNP